LLAVGENNVQEKGDVMIVSLSLLSPKGITFHTKDELIHY
jgi:hypothetical protein